jgi:hypothetical protein
MSDSLANVELMLGGFLLIALGFLVFAYLVMEERRGKVLLRPLSVKANIVANVPFALVVMGIVLVIVGYLSS